MPIPPLLYLRGGRGPLLLQPLGSSPETEVKSLLRASCCCRRDTHHGQSRPGLGVIPPPWPGATAATTPQSLLALPEARWKGISAPKTPRGARNPAPSEKPGEQCTAPPGRQKLKARVRFLAVKA